MKNFLIFKLIIIYAFSISISAQEKLLIKKPVSETYFGKTVVDDFRFLEDSKNELVQEWFKQNNVKARKVLDNISGRKEFLEQFIEFEKRKTAAKNLFGNI